MPITVVIICHGDAQARQLQQLPADAFARADDVVVVRSDVGPHAFPFLYWSIPSSNRVQGFNAGANRDDGLEFSLATFGETDVIFLDGDCAPSPSWIDAHMSAFLRDDPVVSCGSRVEPGIPDSRTRAMGWRGETYLPSMMSGKSVLADIRSIRAHRSVWSCNMGLSVEAIRRLRAAGQTMHGSPRIFSPEFDGAWGGEDTGLAIIAHLSGCKIRMLDPETSWVQHCRHDAWHIDYRNIEKLPAFEERARAVLGGSHEFHRLIPR